MGICTCCGYTYPNVPSGRGTSVSSLRALCQRPSSSRHPHRHQPTRGVPGRGQRRQSAHELYVIHERALRQLWNRDECRRDQKVHRHHAYVEGIDSVA